MKSRINSANIIFYSPTGTSRKIARAIGDGLIIENLAFYDITFNHAEFSIEDEKTLTVFVFPVYAGRIPDTALERIKTIKGNNSLAAIIVVYGNRHYDDALLELRDVVEHQGFTPIAGAAFIGEHSFSRKGMPVAAGRPDMYDIGMAEHFGKEVMDKINSAVNFARLNVPGNFPYRERPEKQKVAPSSTENCIQNGECVDVCPTQAISLREDGELITDIDKCTLCCACVKFCPHNARVFDTPFTKMLFDNYNSRRELEFFF